jgi:hypothetical protein
MHTLPSAFGDRISTSTLFTAWVEGYVAQMDDERLAAGPADKTNREARQKVLHRRFNDETFVVARRVNDVAALMRTM